MMEKHTFRVTIYYPYTLVYEVEAENEENAKDYAFEMAMEYEPEFETEEIR